MLCVTERFFHHPAVVCVCVTQTDRYLDSSAGIFRSFCTPKHLASTHTYARHQSHPISHYTVKRIAGCQYSTHTHTTDTHTSIFVKTFIDVKPLWGFLLCRSAQSKHVSKECSSLSKHLVAGLILETVVTATGVWFKLPVQVCLFMCVLLVLSQSEYVIPGRKKQSARVMWNKWDWSHLVIKNMPTDGARGVVAAKTWSQIWLKMQIEIYIKQLRSTSSPARHLWLIVQLEH